MVFEGPFNNHQKYINRYHYYVKEWSMVNQWLVYWARYYDPRIGRSSSVNPLADKFPHVNPHNHVANNPVKNIDILEAVTTERVRRDHD